MLHRQTCVRVVCTNEKRQLFQAHPPRNVPTLHDIQDALYATERLPYNHKKEYFYAQGIDYDRVVTYHQLVVELNKTIKLPYVQSRTHLAENNPLNHPSY